MFPTPLQIHGFCTDFPLVIISQLVQQPFRVLLVLAERLLQVPILEENYSTEGIHQSIILFRKECQSILTCRP
jgi:hypothetical protein